MPRPFVLSLLVCWLVPTPSSQWPYFPWSSGSQTLDQNHPQKEDELPFPRVLSFFPDPVAEDCLSKDKRRHGICVNRNDCREQRGISSGPCALGLGICCVFTTSCAGEVLRNQTYITSPGFPNLIDQPMNCSVLVKKIDNQISQLRIDFLHFNVGQPNRKTGVCDDDVMLVRSGERTFQLCGWNSGQHIYMDVGEEPVTINFRLLGGLVSRMWELRVVQLGFEQRAPAGCLQYHQSANGTLRTLNYLPGNGRYLANHDYLICMRQEYGMCSVAYSPCSSDSFRIGGPRGAGYNDTSAPLSAGDESQEDDEGSGVGSERLSMVGVDRCKDRVLIPCDFEEFITPGNDVAGICDLEHCGTSLCDTRNLGGGRRSGSTSTESMMSATATPGGSGASACRVETSALPFHIRVAFGSGGQNGSSPEDNIGMCLNYEQLPCLA